jgi:hypothetical protein
MFTESSKPIICLNIGCPTNFISVFLPMLLFVGQNIIIPLAIITPLVGCCGNQLLLF